jgi:hypothetical protein
MEAKAKSSLLARRGVSLPALKLKPSAVMLPFPPRTLSLYGATAYEPIVEPIGRTLSLYGATAYEPSLEPNKNS